MGLGFPFSFVSFLGCMATVMGVLEFGGMGCCVLRFGLTSICLLFLIQYFFRYCF